MHVLFLKYQSTDMQGIRVILSVLVVAISMQYTQAQFRVGIKGGLSSTDLSPSSVIILDQGDAQQFKLDVADAKYGFHLGFFIQGQIGGFFIQPEIIFNSASVDYRLEDLQGGGPVLIKDEVYQNLDLPLLIGAKVGFLRLGAGPVGHLFLDSTSDLFDLEGYDQAFDAMTLGWQAGIGLDIWKLHIDLKYEGNFDNFGEHIVFHGNQYAFDESPARMLASIGISF